MLPFLAYDLWDRIHDSRPQYDRLRLRNPNSRRVMRDSDELPFVSVVAFYYYNDSFADDSLKEVKECGPG